MKVWNVQEMHIIFDKIQDPKAKIGFSMDFDSFLTFKHNLKQEPKLLEQKLNLLKGIGTWKNNHAFWLIEETMQLLIQSGIPQWHRKFIFEVLVHDVRDKESGPKQFKFEGLSFNFIITTCKIFPFRS